MGSAQGTGDRSEDRQIFRYWIDVVEVASGNVRRLPLAAFRAIPLVSSRGPERAPATVLRLGDGGSSIEARSFEDLVAHLRLKYPDGEYERRLGCERDYAAEQQRDAALNGWIELLVEAVAAELMEEERSAPFE